MAKQKNLNLFDDSMVDNVIDEAANDSTVPVILYDITSFGADYDD